MAAPPVYADTCTGCGYVHDSDPGDWPTCPEHGHRMYELGRTDDGWAYACQARSPRPCTHIHTQREKATMTTANEIAGAALAVRDDQPFWEPRQLAALRQLGVDGASNDDLGVFLYRCQVTGLDPFTGQISMVKRGGRWVIQTGIDGYRVIAQRAAKAEGVTLSYGPTKWFDRAGGTHEIWLGDEAPAGASVVVYKNGQPFGGVARFKSFAPMKDGKPMAQWAVMPDHMIAKCAEAQALRRAFPNDLEAIVTSDEAAHDSVAPAVTVQQVTPPPVWPQDEPERYVRGAPQIRRGDMEGLRKAIAAQFDAIGVPPEGDERDNYLHQLANKDADLTERDLRFALDSLATCADLQALVELCNPGDAAS